jgi:CheY-like chemotaxis protein
LQIREGWAEIRVADTGAGIAPELLRADTGRTRLIAVSGYAQPEDIAMAKEAGFEQHIAKPLDPETVRSLLQGYPAMRRESD